MSKANQDFIDLMKSFQELVRQNERSIELGDEPKVYIPVYDIKLMLEGMEVLRVQALTNETMSQRNAYLKQRGDEFKELLMMAVMGQTVEEPVEPKAEFIQEKG